MFAHIFVILEKLLVYCRGLFFPGFPFKYKAGNSE